MKYISTRGDSMQYSSSEAAIKGLADDGGLFVPVSFPKAYGMEELKKLSEMDYRQLAFEIMKPYFDDFTDDELKSCIDSAYDSKFDDPLIAPLVKAGGNYFLELFHGRTLAFKDMALSFLPHLMKASAAKLGINKHILILTATSGDTGKAAMEGFKDVDGVSVIVFYPKNGVSVVQELQMTTQEGGNVTAVAVNGNFDDAQNAVKLIFSDKQFAEKLARDGVILSSANSINIGRLIPQIVYYFYGYFQLAAGGEIKIGDKINFCVPTGNFGNILAAYYAKIMGLPLNRLICASNENKVLFDFFETGAYDKNRDLHVTSSPSMDILVSSNLERLLYHVSGKTTERLMKSLSEAGKYEFDRVLLANEGFIGEYAPEKKSGEAIAELYEDCGYIMDTHTAVAHSSYKGYRRVTGDETKAIITSTASPFKFAKSVMAQIEAGGASSEFEYIKALSGLLAEEVPEQIAELEEKPVRHCACCEKDGAKEFVIKWLKDNLQ